MTARLRPTVTPVSPTGMDLRLVEAMMQTTSSEAFVQLAKRLGAFRVAPDLHRIPSALDLLNAPLAIGETHEQILRYMGRLAGTSFTNSDDFIEWSRTNLPASDLSRLPKSPFRL